GSRVAHCLDVAIVIGGGDAVDLLPRAIAGIAIDEENFERLDEARDALDRRLDVAALVTRGNDDRHGAHLGGSPQRAADGEMPQAQAADERQWREEAVDQTAQPQQAYRR